MKHLVNITSGDILSRTKKGNSLIIHFGIALGFNSFGIFEIIENTDIFGV